jgi:hypothetical protein
MTDDALEELRALRRRLAQLEALAAQQAEAKPVFREEDVANPAYFAAHRKEILAAAPEGRIVSRAASIGDAINVLRTTGSASGPAIDALRRQITEGPTPATAPSRDALAEAVRVLTADTRGSSSIAGAFEAMKARASRLDAIESVDPGGSGRVDPTDPATATAAERLDRVLKGKRP